MMFVVGIIVGVFVGMLIMACCFNSHVSDESSKQNIKRIRE